MNVSIKLEKVRLVIWDLDDTFWSGTLTEGGVTQIRQHLDIVKTLSERGIVNSICSKNDHDKVQAELERIGLWEYFVLCRIAWQGKGAMVRSIVQSSQLRPETVMFIDDNPINLNEVRHYNPGIQLEDPAFLERLLDDPRFIGKDDSGLTRLAQYKVLEKKEKDSAEFANSNSDFLRQSEIQISFHQDVLAEFDRVHELINRTNQLNFTKLRLPEDREEAYAELEKEINLGGVHAAYVKVSDKYGEYGIVGFYLSKAQMGVGRKLKHFTFSCRTLNMGIEQFVYRKLSRPKLDISGEVVSDISGNQPIDWIKVVDDAGQRDNAAGLPSKIICMRGSCDLDQLIHYLGYRFDVRREFPFPYKGAVVAMSAAQFLSVFDELRKPEHQILMQRLPFLHPNLLKSTILSGVADTFIVSFAMEEQWNYFRYNPTGLIVPMRFAAGVDLPYAELTQLAYDQVKSRTKLEFSEDEWRWFQQNFEYVGGFDPSRFEGNVKDLFVRLAGRQVLLVLANTKNGPPCRELEVNAEINAIVERVSAPFLPEIVRFDDLVRSDHEVKSPNHYTREVFPRLAEAVRGLIDSAPPRERHQDLKTA